MPAPWLGALAALLFVPLFLAQGRGGGPDFWWWLSFNIVLGTAAGAWRNRAFFERLRSDLSGETARKLGLGLLSAVFLYFFFAAGNGISRLLFSWAGGGIDGVYAFKGGASGLRIGLLMVLVIGPGEELLWRALLQDGLSARYGRLRGFLLATALYTGVHLFSFNPMLIAAAAVCGAFWGLLYLRFRSPLLNIVSHTLWDIGVFLLFPFSS